MQSARFSQRTGYSDSLMQFKWLYGAVLSENSSADDHLNAGAYGYADVGVRCVTRSLCAGCTYDPRLNDTIVVSDRANSRYEQSSNNCTVSFDQPAAPGNSSCNSICSMHCTTRSTTLTAPCLLIARCFGKSHGALLGAGSSSSTTTLPSRPSSNGTRQSRWYVILRGTTELHQQKAAVPCGPGKELAVVHKYRQQH